MFLTLYFVSGLPDIYRGGNPRICHAKLRYPRRISSLSSGIPRKSRLSDVHREGVLKTVFRVGFQGRFGFFVPDCGVNGREEGVGIGNGGADMRDIEFVGRINRALVSFRATEDETFLPAMKKLLKVAASASFLKMCMVARLPIMMKVCRFGLPE